MNKTYCDKCANEITNKEIKRASINIGSGKYTLIITPIVAMEEPERRGDSRINITDEHDICTHCIIDAFNALDDRK